MEATTAKRDPIYGRRTANSLPTRVFAFLACDTDDYTFHCTGILLHISVVVTVV